MQKFKFKPEDFNIFSSKGYALKPLHLRKISEVANEILEAEIQKWPILYGANEYSKNSSVWRPEMFEGANRSARLAFVTELVKAECKHEPDHATFFDESIADNGPVHMKCEHCKVELVATWSVKEG